MWGGWHAGCPGSTNGRIACIQHGSARDSPEYAYALNCTLSVDRSRCCDHLMERRTRSNTTTPVARYLHGRGGRGSRVARAAEQALRTAMHAPHLLRSRSSPSSWRCSCVA